VSQFVHDTVINAPLLLSPRDCVFMAGDFGRCAGFRNVFGRRWNKLFEIGSLLKKGFGVMGCRILLKCALFGRPAWFGASRRSPKVKSHGLFDGRSTCATLLL
jgi:hypothetical protein